ncbi:MAG: ribokinase [Betaproteobacteria bacterium]|nr:ribokinase [Betaproteobacteria bacterium]
MIIVFGSVNLDLVARVARLPQPGETLAGEAFAMLPGGKGANQALAAARAGGEVRLVAAVGDDAFAAPALARLAAGGVDLAGVRRVGAPTGVALIHVDGRGENAITVVAGANALADPAWLPDESLEAGTTLLLQLEVPLAAVVAAAARARTRGARVMLNAAPMQLLPQALVATLDVLLVNETEAAAMAGMLGAPATPDEFATAVHRKFGVATVVTLGGEGAFAAADGHLYAVPAPPVRVVDTTGAGDAFCGALAAALDRSATWPRALAEAIAAGSLACTASGAQPALPDAQAIAALAATVGGRVVTIAAG